MSKLKPTKVPGLPAIPSDASPDLKAYLKALGEALEIRLGRRGDQRDRAITLRELIDSGLAKELKSAPFNPNKSSEIHVGISSITGPHLLTPPTPSGFTVSGAFKNVVLNWSDPNFIYSNHSYTEVFRQNAQAADPDGIAESQTLGGAGNLSFTGVLSTQDATNGTIQNSTITFNAPTKVTITSLGSDESGRNFTVTGTNASGSTVDSGAVAGPTAGATKEFSSTDSGSGGLFKTVTEIACSSNIVGNVSAGCAESADEIGNATSIGSSGSMVATDAAVAAGEAYFYWIRFVSEEGVAGPFNSTNGTIASTVRIQETDISEDAITTPKLKAGAITADKGMFATAAIVSADIANAAITDAKINFLANDQAVINTAHIVNAAITTAKIQNLAATTDKINDAAITTAKINDLAVVTLKIAGNAVTIPEASFTAGTNTNTTLQSVSFTVPSDTGISGFTMDIVLTFSCQPFCISDDGSDSALISFQRSGSNLTLTGANNFGYKNDPYEETGTAGHTMKMPPISVSVLDENVSPGTYTYSVIHSGSFGVNFKFESRLLLALGVKR